MANLNITGNLTEQNKRAVCVESMGGEYVRLTNGLQLCWGTLTSSTEGEQTYSFPQPFNSIPVVMRTNMGKTNGEVVIRNLSIYNISTTSCTVYIYKQDPNAQIFAIGYWK